MGGGVDLFNHKRNSGHIQWGKGRDSNMFQVVTSEGIEAGDQAHISYGDKCNLSLLLEYTPPHEPHTLSLLLLFFFITLKPRVE